MRVLVFCDDLFHPATTVRAGLAPLVKEGFSFDWVEDATAWEPSELSRYQVALLSKSNVCSHANKTPWLRGDAEFVFRDHGARGGGLVVVHSGTAGYREVAPVRAVTGGAFLSHPPQCEVLLKPAPGHPMTAGADEPFTVVDEHYLMALDDTGADVFLRSHSAHGDEPAGWTRHEGKGCVCVLTPGHNAEVWLHPSYQRLLGNALRWVTPPFTA